jgi:hypothetical protein
MASDGQELAGRVSSMPFVNPQSFGRFRFDMEGQHLATWIGCVFQMWNNSKSPIRYMWGKISDCHIIEVEPCTGVIGTSGTIEGYDLLMAGRRRHCSSTCKNLCVL